MKKEYITPTVLIVKVRCTSFLAESYTLQDKGADTGVGQLVKENNFSGSRYNVWNEDWSAE